MKKAMFNFGGVIIIALVAAMVGLYLITPSAQKIIFWIGVIAFAVGMLSISYQNHILIIITGALYGLFYEVLRNLNVMDNPIISIIYSPAAIVGVGFFITGRYLGRIVLGLIGVAI